MSNEIPKLNIAVVDDHGLYRSGLTNLIESLSDNLKVVLTASNGKEFLDLLKTNTLPDLVILDVDMPILNGFETAKIMSKEYPSIPILIITMLSDEASLIRMLRNGVRGYLSKDIEPSELKSAILAISQKGFHYTDVITGRLINSIQNDEVEQENLQKLSNRELTFIEYCCSEKTYKQIAEEMLLSPKTIDGYRAALFEKLEVKTRVGLVLFAIKNGYVKV
ncbi:response regulator transcription factor [Crocinitomix catalasitica]|uniref:response regulator transcription factor n=1 Tax=Crocinitomix catalasitica TaxID=184607 RepID=UPI00048569CA|nr:response regulator transcription factor [Crocinitomix catalasitica]